MSSPSNKIGTLMRSAKRSLDEYDATVSGQLREYQLEFMRLQREEEQIRDDKQLEVQLSAKYCQRCAASTVRKPVSLIETISQWLSSCYTIVAAFFNGRHQELHADIDERQPVEANVPPVRHNFAIAQPPPLYSDDLVSLLGSPYSFSKDSPALLDPSLERFWLRDCLESPQSPYDSSNDSPTSPDSSLVRFLLDSLKPPQVHAEDEPSSDSTGTLESEHVAVSPSPQVPRGLS
ncbi:hypothetical protein KC336_g5682 [Hortaea werneckii]|nr:hypothetical protein KC336_g5682 [Hortaea werneckii]